MGHLELHGWFLQLQLDKVTKDMALRRGHEEVGGEDGARGRATGPLMASGEA